MLAVDQRSSLVVCCVWIRGDRERKRERRGQRVIANSITGKYLLIPAWWSSYEPAMMKLPPCFHLIHSPKSTYMRQKWMCQTAESIRTQGKEARTKNIPREGAERIKKWLKEPDCHFVKIIEETRTVEIQQRHFYWLLILIFGNPRAAIRVV